MCNFGCCFFETLAQSCQFNSAIIAGVVVLYSAACKYWDSDTISVVLALYSSKWTWNETITEIKVVTFSFKGILKVFTYILFDFGVGINPLYTIPTLFT